MARINMLLVVLSLWGLAGVALAQIDEIQSDRAQYSQTVYMIDDEENSATSNLSDELNDKASNKASLEQALAAIKQEKAAGLAKTNLLRAKVRQFIQQRIETLNTFLMDGDLLDYVGAELISRSQIQAQAVTLVDLANPVPQSGVLTGGGIYLASPTQIKVTVLRSIRDRLIPLWQSNSIELTELGENRFMFTTSVNVEQGDIIAYQLADGASVQFDKGTGDTRYLTKPLALGEGIRLRSLKGKSERRAYALGVYGLLSQPQ
ncbi:hypothetical protein DXX93_14770 [Thalassotalea euphylliae]|uniref:Uncharacterized protein n=1 Tax=Thalassotalea euphylliae TaxID=1655234 RepID=A0A3E0TUU7_9GAMM|nr:hypothetical protein [Thalassotalea euphylliae]REL27695.1 hypothetical protein DXX93_14770 [Thalassotalea euphylliae]